MRQLDSTPYPHRLSSKAALVYIGPQDKDGRPMPETGTGPGQKWEALVIGYNASNGNQPCMILRMDPTGNTINSRVIGHGSNSTGCEYHTATRVGDCVYVFGGNAHNTQLSCYTIATETWHVVPNNGSWPNGRNQHCAFCLAGKLYIAGGGNNDTWAFDPSTQTWQNMGHGFPSGYQTNNSSTVVVGNTVHLLGDSNGYRSYYMHCTYTQAGGWVNETNTPFQLHSGAAVLVGDDILVMGGYYHANQMHMYHTQSKTWVQLPQTLPASNTNMCYGTFVNPSTILLHTYSGFVVVQDPAWQQEYERRTRILEILPLLEQLGQPLTPDSSVEDAVITLAKVLVEMSEKSKKGPEEETLLKAFTDYSPDSRNALRGIIEGVEAFDIEELTTHLSHLAEAPQG
ncbi:hypothetical protein KIPB_006642 [Kipferlia bialata]|uniref:Uncharacterized protein n=1 Tax=Kipferlia bialata TaxID=797122 RepID=A0A9K3GJE2_9EUKA|nr:hypothetical protein KIPB_006642 [Kipferlia bialata]|eukprot:g6642.t1